MPLENWPKEEDIAANPPKNDIVAKSIIVTNSYRPTNELWGKEIPPLINGLITYDPVENKFLFCQNGEWVTLQDKELFAELELNISAMISKSNSALSEMMEQQMASMKITLDNAITELRCKVNQIESDIDAQRIAADMRERIYSDHSSKIDKLFDLLPEIGVIRTEMELIESNFSKEQSEIKKEINKKVDYLQKDIDEIDATFGEKFKLISSEINALKSRDDLAARQKELDSLRSKLDLEQQKINELNKANK